MDPEARRHPRLTTSLATLAAGIAMAAVALALVRAIATRGDGAAPSTPADDSSLDEDALASDDLRVQVGPNMVGLAAVARNDRDGSVRVEDGQGRAIEAPGLGLDSGLVGPSAWLDVANVQLGPEAVRLDVIEVRVFDHRTRRSLIRDDPTAGRGYRMVSPSVVQLRSLGGPLPEAVDVWFRAASHGPGEPVVRLRAEPGASAPFTEGSLSVREIRPGIFTYRPALRPGSPPPESIRTSPPEGIDRAITVVFDLEGRWVEGRYQITAVGADGRKILPDFPHFVDFRKMGASQVITFAMAPVEVDHFELRPFDGRHTFYFNGPRES